MLYCVYTRDSIRYEYLCSDFCMDIWSKYVRLVSLTFSANAYKYVQYRSIFKLNSIDKFRQGYQKLYANLIETLAYIQSIQVKKNCWTFCVIPPPPALPWISSLVRYHRIPLNWNIKISSIFFRSFTFFLFTHLVHSPCFHSIFIFF